MYQNQGSKLRAERYPLGLHMSTAHTGCAASLVLPLLTDKARRPHGFRACVLDVFTEPLGLWPAPPT